MFLALPGMFLDHRKMFLEIPRMFRKLRRMFLDPRKTLLNRRRMFLNFRKMFLELRKFLRNHPEMFRTFPCEPFRPGSPAPTPRQARLSRPHPKTRPPPQPLPHPPPRRYNASISRHAELHRRSGYFTSYPAVEPRRRKRLIVGLVIAACLVLAYVGSYVALSAAGNYRASQTGKLRNFGGLSVTDVYHWQPRFMWWEPFRDVRGKDTSRGDLLGSFYSPLIRIDRAWRHPSQYLFEESAATQPADDRTSSSSNDTQARITAAEAVAIAEPALAAGFPDSFEDCRPYRADYRDGIWHVRGTLPEGMLGGTPEAEVRDADGEILRIFHTQ
jgi:hypothetical protein